MKNGKTIIITACFLLALASTSYGQLKILSEKNPFKTVSDKLKTNDPSEKKAPFDRSVAPKRNPFKSQLPVTIEETEGPATPVIKPPKPIQPPRPPKPTPPKVEPVLPKPPRLRVKAPTIQPPALRISGVIWNTDRPQAIINDQVVSVGDTIANSTIKDITKENIVVVFSEKEFTIKY